METKRLGKVWLPIILALIIVGVIGGVAFAKVKENELAKQEQLRIEKEKKTEILLAEAESLAKGYFYEEALAKLKSDPTLYDEAATDGAINLSIKKTEEMQASLVKYEGPPEHVFFHSLIVYPQLAFDNYGHPAQGYNMWMTTVKEFQTMLPYLYEGGYVLYPQDQYIEPDPARPGCIKYKDILLPPGKRPLVISIDDVCYYDYMKPDGFANRLVVGEDGRVWTEVITPEGEVTVTRDGDVMPILDDFVAEHPDFSWRGAKGVIAVTGYQGALGYRITDDLPTEAADQQTVKQISDILRADGWLFACHSYTHNGYFRTGKVTMEQMKYDTDRWKEKIEPWVGKTNIYISPFGWQWNNNNPIHRYIAESGFNIFCPVSNTRRLAIFDDIMVMPRVNLDGYYMNHRKAEAAAHYFPVDKVLDPARPPLL